MSYMRECVNGISKVLFVTALSVYAFSYVLDTHQGEKVYSSINNFISGVIFPDSTSRRDSLLDSVFTPKPVPLEDIE